MRDGTRVYVIRENKNGTVKFSVPGNGTYRWYVVEFEDGSEDLYTIEDLKQI